jgi:hypothetical protein
MEINDADRQQILRIIAERLHNYTVTWKSPEFAALADSNWSDNRESILRPDYELFLRLGGNPEHPMLKLFREHWGF